MSEIIDLSNISSFHKTCESINLPEKVVISLLKNQIMQNSLMYDETCFYSAEDMYNKYGGHEISKYEKHVYIFSKRFQLVEKKKEKLEKQKEKLEKQKEEEEHKKTEYEETKEKLEKNLFKLLNPPIFVKIWENGDLQLIKSQADLFHIFSDITGKYNLKRWLDDPEKRTYKKLEFSPKQKLNDEMIYNLFNIETGFSYEISSCEPENDELKYPQEILMNICNTKNNDALRNI